MWVRKAHAGVHDSDRDAGTESDQGGRLRIGLGIYQIEETYADPASTDE